jgi:hypothetical protein
MEVGDRNIEVENGPSRTNGEKESCGAQAAPEKVGHPRLPHSLSTPSYRDRSLRRHHDCLAESANAW